MVTFKQFVLESVPGYGDAEPTSKYPEGKPKLAWIEYEKPTDEYPEGRWQFFNAAGVSKVTVTSKKRAREMKEFLKNKKRWKFKGQLDIDF